MTPSLRLVYARAGTPETEHGFKPNEFRKPAAINGTRKALGYDSYSIGTSGGASIEASCKGVSCAMPMIWWSSRNTIPSRNGNGWSDS